MADRTFIKITNKDIWNKLNDIESKLNATHEQAVATNSKVKLHTKLIIGLSSSIITVTGWFIYHLIL